MQIENQNKKNYFAPLLFVACTFCLYLMAVCAVFMQHKCHCRTRDWFFMGHQHCFCDVSLCACVVSTGSFTLNKVKLAPQPLGDMIQIHEQRLAHNNGVFPKQVRVTAQLGHQSINQLDRALWCRCNLQPCRLSSCHMFSAAQQHNHNYKYSNVSLCSMTQSPRPTAGDSNMASV